MSQIEWTAVTKLLASRDVSFPPCALCGHRRWLASSYPCMAMEQLGADEVAAGTAPRGHTLIPVVCAHCGHTLLIHATVLLAAYTEVTDPGLTELTNGKGEWIQTQ